MFLNRLLLILSIDVDTKKLKAKDFHKITFKDGVVKCFTEKGNEIACRNMNPNCNNDQAEPTPSESDENDDKAKKREETVKKQTPNTHLVKKRQDKPLKTSFYDGDFFPPNVQQDSRPGPENTETSAPKPDPVDMKKVIKSPVPEDSEYEEDRTSTNGFDKGLENKEDPCDDDQNKKVQSLLSPDQKDAMSKEGDSKKERNKSDNANEKDDVSADLSQIDNTSKPKSKNSKVETPPTTKQLNNITNVNDKEYQHTKAPTD